MIAPLAKFLDWYAIQVLALLMRSPTSAGLDEAVKFLTGPDFSPDESQPASIVFDPPESGIHFHFPTPQPGAYAENNIVYGRLYRCGERWQERPAIILLHGGGGFPDHQIRFPLIARHCNQAAFNAVTLAAPYHFQRRPRQLPAPGFPNCLQVARATAQSVSEIRAMTGWLLRNGCPAVSLWGYSMGAWQAGIAACRDTRLTAVVLACPPGRLNPWIEQRAIWPHIRRRLNAVREVCEKFNQTTLNLKRTPPVIPRENILLIEGTHDLFVPREGVEDLWQAWGQPDIWRVPHGHAGICGGAAPGLTKRVIRWLSPRLNATVANL